jgi:site-specific DNA-methyltransferase (adenine-specific)
VKPYYEDAVVALYLGDCREVLPELRADVVVTDPPYNAGKNYGKTTNDRMEWPEWCAWWDSVLDLLLATAPDALAFLSITAFRKYCRLGQREPEWAACWVKPLSMSVCALPFMPHWEPIAYWGTSRKVDGAFWGGDVFTANVEFGQERWNHPTPKPLLLMLEIVSRFDGTIIDPFAGSGTTLAACKQLGKRAIGIEISEQFCEEQALRLECTAVGVRAARSQGALDLFGEQSA